MSIKPFKAIEAYPWPVSWHLNPQSIKHDDEYKFLTKLKVHLTCRDKRKKMSSKTFSSAAFLAVILMSMVLHGNTFTPSGVKGSRLRNIRGGNLGVFKCEEVNIVKTVVGRKFSSIT